MLRLLFLSLMVLALGTATVTADNAPEWRNPKVNQQNREPRHANFFAFENEELAKARRHPIVICQWRACGASSS